MLDLLLSRAAITAMPLEELHVHWALVGRRRFGRGRRFCSRETTSPPPT
jgi:hypothetical protein